MDGVAAVHQRIAEIQSRFGTPGVTARAAAAPVALPATTPVTFEASLAAALAGTGTAAPAATRASAAPGAATALTPAQRLAPGQYGRLEPPAELVAYGNGRIPAGALEEIGVGQHRLWAPAARAYRQMVDAARTEGVTIGITDSYRDYDSQVDLARRKGLYSQGGLAATPGTSNHGWGLAVDLDLDARAQQWMRDNAWRFGFVEDVPREPWHWTYRPAP